MLYPDFQELIHLGARPNRLEATSSRPALEASFGNYASPFRGQGLTFHEVREYRHGDDIRNIDWRVTARSNKPHMKVFTEDRERIVMLCVDANATMRFGTRGTFKSIQAARAAALIGRLANGSRDRVGCVIFGDVPEGIQYFRPVRSRRSLWQALRLLSEPKTGSAPAICQVEAAVRRLDRISHTGSLAFIISDFYPITASFESNLMRLKNRCDVVLVSIDDPSDAVLPATGIVKFSGENGPSLSIDTDDQVGRESYEGEWVRHRQSLDEICRRRGVHLIALHTHRDIQDDLVPALHRLQGKSRP